MEGKVCKKCGVEKPLDCYSVVFYKRNKKYYTEGRCVACVRKNTYKHAHGNREKTRKIGFIGYKKSKKFYYRTHKNMEKHRLYRKLYYEKNKEKASLYRENNIIILKGRFYNLNTCPEKLKPILELLIKCKKMMKFEKKLQGETNVI